MHPIKNIFMKSLLKYCLLGILFMLFNTVAMKAHTPIRTHQNRVGYSYISQEQANRNAVQLIYLIYSNTPFELINFDHTKSFSFKNIGRLLIGLNEHLNMLQNSDKPDEQSYSDFHPKPIGYYVFALNKIVI